MNKTYGSKKNSVEQLYQILNDDYKKNKSAEENSYLKSLLIRLKSSDKEILLKPRVVKGTKEKDSDFLKPKVNIHARKKKTIEIIEYKKEKPKEKLYEKDLFEVEKVDVIETKFIEVKPKVITKLKTDEKEELPEEELVEWDEVKISKIEPEEIKVEISEKETTEPVEFIEKTDNEIIEEPKKEGKIEVEKKTLIEEIPTETKSIPKEPSLDFIKKIETFKDYETINEKTAIILYNNGFTTTDLLKKATLKDLKKIEGINRRTAKKIKKEINKKIEEEKTLQISESLEEEIKEEEKPEEPEKIKEELTSDEKLKTKYLEWEPIEVKEFEEKELTIKTEESIEERNKKIETFKDYETINEKTAIILYNNGFTTTDLLKKATLKDLKKIEGINRRTAKKIKKEINKKIEEEKPILFEDEEEEERLDEDIIEEEKEKEIIKKYHEEEIFKGLISIDEKIAKLLIENGIDSIDELKKMTVQDLKSIKGIKRRIAKKIIKEVTNLPEKAEKLTIKKSSKTKKQVRKKSKKKTTSKKKKVSKTGKKQIKGFTQRGYILYEKKIKTKSGNIRTIRFFSKSKHKKAKPIEKPKNYKVLINKKTGVPYIKKKK